MQGRGRVRAPGDACRDGEGGYCRLCPVCPARRDCTCISVHLVTMTAAGPSGAGDGQALLSFTHPNLLTFTENRQGRGTIPALGGEVPRPHSKPMVVYSA